MTTPHGRSVEEIRRDAEQTRAGLTKTVDQLKQTVTQTADDWRESVRPAAIKAEISEYVRSRGEQLVADISSAARDNPLQAAAIGLGLAYPVLRIARGIPAPIVLIGAGLFFAGSKTGQKLAGNAVDAASDLTDTVTRRSHDVTEQLSATADTLAGYAATAMDRTHEAVIGTGENLKNSAAGLASSVQSSVQSLAFNGQAAAAVAADRVSAQSKSSVDTVRHSGQSFLQVVEQNPLLVASVGFLIGGLIASALPRSNVEDELLGATSSSLKKSADAMAKQGVTKAKDAAEDILDAAATRAAQEGLTVEGLTKAVDGLGQRVRHVADAAASAAFGADKNNEKSPSKEPSHDRS